MTNFPSRELSAVLSRVLSPDRKSDFYIDRLGSKIEFRDLSQEQWAALPVLTRESIQKTAFWDRVFSDSRDVRVIRHTSGSSGSRVLITPRISYGDYHAPIGSTGATRILYFNFASFHEFPREETGITPIIGDAGDLHASARLARLAGADSIHMTPQTALIFSDLLEAEGILSSIRAVLLCGERCSPIQLNKLRGRYTSAEVTNIYASSESREVVAYTCPHMRKGNSLFLQPVREIYCEIVSPETGMSVTDPDTFGELVITTLFPVPFPLIRYKTGDIARFVHRGCPCDEEGLGIEIVGRQTVFPVRVTRGEITVDACELALHEVLGHVPYFELHLKEVESAKSALPQLHVVVVGKGDALPFAEDLAQKIKINAHYTYADGVRDNLYQPLTVAYIDAAPPGPIGKPKTPVLVRHYE